MRITFFCLGQKAYISLKNIPQQYISCIECIVIGTDSQISNDYSNDIQLWAEKKSIPYIYRNEIKKRKLETEYFIAIGWRWIINIDESQKLIVLHDSILPKYRGFNPLVTALIQGDNEIGVTALFGNENYDTGDIIIQKSTTISYPIKIKKAIDIISSLYADVILEIIQKIYYNEPLNATPQNSLLASYSLWRDNDDYKINWNKSAKEIERFINAVGEPYLGASTFLNNKEYKIIKAQVFKDVTIVNRDVGKVIFKNNNNLVIVCGTGLLEIIDMIDIETKEKVDTLPLFRCRFY